MRAGNNVVTLVPRDDAQRRRKSGGRRTSQRLPAYNRQSGGGVMAMATWRLSGQYYETCSCDFVCPCLPGQLTVRPTKGSCTFAMAFQIDRGIYGDVPLDGLG